MKRAVVLAVVALSVACMVDSAREPVGDPSTGSDAGTLIDGGNGDIDAGNADAGPPFVYPRKWGAPVALAELNSSSMDTLPAMSEDMLRICFSSDRKRPEVDYDLYCATRISVDEPFTAPVLQTNINSDTSESNPILLGNEIYFGSWRSGTYEAYRATWNKLAGAYDAPELMEALTAVTGGGVSDISPDGLTALFYSDRSGGAGDFDIWATTRASLSSEWSTPVNLSSVNSSKLDVSASMAADGSLLVLTSLRGGSFVWLAEANPAGGWMTPKPIDYQKPANFSLMNARLLLNGWLLASGQVTSGKDDLYLVPPREADEP